MSKKVNVTDVVLTKDYFDAKISQLESNLNAANGKRIADIFTFIRENQESWNKAQVKQDIRIGRVEDRVDRLESNKNIVIRVAVGIASIVVLGILIFGVATGHIVLW